MKISIIKQIVVDAWQAIHISYLSSRRDRYGYIHPSATVLLPCVMNKKNVFLYEETKIGENSTIICNKGKFIMKKNSRSGPRLTVICQNHNIFEVGTYPGDKNWSSGEIASDVIVEEGVWLGANVTLCPGTRIQRGCIVAAGSVCVASKIYPPYTVIGGNPAKVIKYRFTLDEQYKHEELLYNTSERLDRQIMKEFFDKFSK